jgi:hypothetical protein
MASPLDTSQADLVLLSQNLAKAKRTSDRLTGMLSSFDEKLVRLEKGVTSIHKSTGGLTRVNRSESCFLSSRCTTGLFAHLMLFLHTDIQAALSQIDIVLSHHDLVDREELGIKRGCVC